MIKIDQLKLLDNTKKVVIVSGIVSIFLCIYTIPLVILSYVCKKRQIKRTYYIIPNIILALICISWFSIVDYSLADFIKPYFEYTKYIFLIDPIRLLISVTYTIFFIKYGHLLEEGMEDWVIQKEKKKRERMVPYGKYEYSDRSHMLIFGATRMGKGVFINHILDDRIDKSQKELVVMISAKQASTDSHSQLAYVRKIAEACGRELYVISMDETVTDRYQYNPFKHLSYDEMLNSLTTMLEFDSHFYRGNFVDWVMCIYTLLRKSNKTVSIRNILKLYDFDDYRDYAKRQLDKGSISAEDYEELVNKTTEKYAKTSLNDDASLNMIANACHSVFNPTPNGKKISIDDAFNENALVYIDLNGTSAAEAVRMLGGACIMQELQHCIVKYSNPNQKKTIICDEASYYINPQLVKAFFNVAASAGYQTIISTQGPSDISNSQDNLINQLTTNVGQICTFRVKSDKDVEVIESVFGTEVTTENTHRAFSIEYNETGSIKAKDQFHVSAEMIRTLPPLEMVYYRTDASLNYEAKVKRVKMRYDDLIC